MTVDAIFVALAQLLTQHLFTIIYNYLQLCAIVCHLAELFDENRDGWVFVKGKEVVD